MITTKEKIIRKSIAEIEIEIKKIDEFLSATPLSDVIQLDIDSIEAVKKMPIEEAGPFLDKALKKRIALLRLAKKQISDSGKMIERKVELESEFCDLRNELYYIERKKAEK